MKLDRVDGTGWFMTFKGTDKISYVIDSTTKKECTVTHAIFDEAAMSVPKSAQPPMATALQQAGYVSKHENRPITLEVQMMDAEVKIPRKATAGAAGYDIYCGEAITIEPGDQSKIRTKMKMAIPEGYYGQLLVRSSFATRYKARIEAGTIDSDYRGEVFVVMSNNGNNPITIAQNDRFAQLVLIKIPSASVEAVTEVDTTARGNKGFGSTGTNNDEPSKVCLLFDEFDSDQSSHIDYEPLYNVHLSSNPYIDIMPVKLLSKGHHPTRGLILQQSTKYDGRVIVDTCLRGSPASRIEKWSKWLKRLILLRIDDCVITKPQDAVDYFATLPNDQEVTLYIGLTERRAMHDQTGMPMMYFDQLVNIAQHLQQIISLSVCLSLLYIKLTDRWIDRETDR